ncbi:hypothetical protein P692DRAFT_20875515 [Suillus brevipes Sb2]|nr:hypothetical protein P692DRAFT_20875515 [Suillus brevipes Sb2]
MLEIIHIFNRQAEIVKLTSLVTNRRTFDNLSKANVQPTPFQLPLDLLDYLSQRYIRFPERVQESEINEGEMDASENENIEAAYTRALSTTLFTRGRKSDAEVDADQIVPLVLARAGVEKRAVEAGRADGDGLTILIKVVEDGIAMYPSSSVEPWRSRFRLEKFLFEFLSAERALELHGRELEPDRAISVLISNPELKKERSDADANERELYVASLSKFATREGLTLSYQLYGRWHMVSFKLRLSSPF